VLGILLIILGRRWLSSRMAGAFQALVAYGYAARIPVAIIMFFANPRAVGNALRFGAARILPAPHPSRQVLLIAFLPQMVGNGSPSQCWWVRLWGQSYRRWHFAQVGARDVVTRA